MTNKLSCRTEHSTILLRLHIFSRLLFKLLHAHTNTEQPLISMLIKFCHVSTYAFCFICVLICCCFFCFGRRIGNISVFLNNTNGCIFFCVNNLSCCGRSMNINRNVVWLRPFLLEFFALQNWYEPLFIFQIRKISKYIIYP